MESDTLSQSDENKIDSYVENFTDFSNNCLQYDTKFDVANQQGYIILEKISKGSFGQVYKAISNKNNEHVIIKIIEIEDDKTLKRIHNDAGIPKIIIHKNIVKINDFFDNNEYAYIVYPYDDNSTCLFAMNLKLNTKKRLSFIVSAMCQICDAIEFMHSHNVYHRDIKPQNIILNNDTAIIIDFDLAFVANDNIFSCVNKVCGTPYYIAPELWLDTNDINYQQTDIYAFGVTLYFTFNMKKLPYNANSLEDLSKMIRHKNPEPSRSGYDELDKIIMKAMSRKSSVRPKISDIKAVLEKIVFI